ncbi:competence type IV pilus minor pilin ComGG [Bacillus sp. FJAT-49736]|uniref:competence type IV pilus minor pilin ComGG n=1 Tax=Bacillus sp. FJAT-49736 TaxID=2833582 RepID=UPI001BC8EECA|nr:competence type IV pilus minor pilin ComGG [Bacillus sp. FJAT-49736]MBS4173450.1 hypothetical protein [Bacillus sp. FJAT-49736]
MKNEKGYILPFTLMLSFLAFFVFVSSVQIYVSESRYIHEAKGYYIRNSIMILGLKTLINHIENQSIQDHGMLSFEEGTVSYRIESLDEHKYRIILETNLSYGQETKNELVYDHYRKSITKWIEM